MGAGGKELVRTRGLADGQPAPLDGTSAFLESGRCVLPRPYKIEETFDASRYKRS